MLPYPVRNLHKTLQRYTGFCFSPMNSHLLQVLPDDTFLVSYPKSGNTWIRFILGNLMWPDSESTNFRNVEYRIPGIHQVNALRAQRAQQPRILKSHFPFKPEYPKVLYIVRNPKSVAVSEYRYLQRMGRKLGNVSFDEFFEAFLKGPVPQYGNWGSHVNSWVCGKGMEKRNFSIIRYEDLQESPEREVRRMAEFLAYFPTNRAIETALANSSFDKMRELENKQEDPSEYKVPFVRKGNNSEWKNYLSKEQERQLEEHFKTAMEKMGYLG